MWGGFRGHRPVLPLIARGKRGGGRYEQRAGGSLRDRFFSDHQRYELYMHTKRDPQEINDWRTLSSASCGRLSRFKPAREALSRMKDELKYIHSPDTDLEKGPLLSDALIVPLMIGPIGGAGEETFDLMVCTPEARESVADSNSNRYLLVLERRDVALIKRYADGLLRDIERPTWLEPAGEIGKIARWKSHEYRP